MPTESVIDGDGHVVEIGRDLARFGWDSSTTTGFELLDRLLVQDPESMRRSLHPAAGTGAFDPEQRLRDMDSEHIEVAVNFPTWLLLVSQLTASVTGPLSLAYNSWFSATYHSLTADRLKAVALVPLGDVDLAVSETRRAVTELGAVGVMVSPYVGTLHLDDPSLDPLWSTIQDLNAPIAVHGGRENTAPLLLGSSFKDQKRYYAVSHPFGQMVAIGDLVIGGVLARFPRLRVVFLESGAGWFPWYIDRLDEAFKSVDPGDNKPVLIDRKPSEYLLGGNCFFSCEPDEPGLVTTLNLLGEGQVIFASDYPHFDCAFPNSVRDLSQSGLSTSVLKKVLVDNATRLYRL